MTLLQKFLECDVIEDVKSKDSCKFESGNRLYRFVTSPGPLNFLEMTPKKQADTSTDSEYVTANPCVLFNTTQDELDTSDHNSSFTAAEPQEVVDVNKVWKDFIISK